MRNSIKTIEKKVDDVENEKETIHLIQRMKTDMEQYMISINSRIDAIDKRLSNLELQVQATPNHPKT